MLEPLELRSYPSCDNCLSWSADGEIAVASGEIVYVLSPKPNREEKQQDQAAQRSSGAQWDISKLKTNAFTLDELPLLLPEPGATFSIGEEQSMSPAIAVAWSAPRLAAYGKCMLAVLTSNLALSLWQAVDGASKWNRALVVNHALRKYFKTLTGDNGPLLRRKQRIRAFSWNYFALNKFNDPDSCHNSGINFLVVSNDTNDIVILRVTAPSYGQSASAVVLTHYSASSEGICLSRSIEQGSMFSGYTAKRATITRVSSSTWLNKPMLGDHGAADLRIWSSLIAFMFGSELAILRLDLDTISMNTEITIKRIELLNLEWTLDYTTTDRDIKGPLHWIETAETSHNLGLAAGIICGFVILTIPKNIWSESILRVDIHEEKFDASLAKWHPISGFTSRVGDTSNSSDLYILTLSSLHQLEFPSMRSKKQPLSNGNEFSQDDYLRRNVEGCRDRFDLDYDLGGMSTAKTWGLCSHRGWIATCATFHPTDMVQHTTSSQERTTIFFAPPSLERSDHTEPGLPWHMPAITPTSIQHSAGKVIAFTLANKQPQSPDDLWLRKLLYAAACSTVFHSALESSSLAKEVLQDLARESSIDLGLEISMLEDLAEGSDKLKAVTIPPKSTEQLESNGAGVYEQCDICGGGIEWFSPVESQCVGGHLFARCALTFLSIQNPSISKRCCRCGRECLDNTSEAMGIEGTKGLLAKLLERFDECPYCGGKFKA
ncbi:TPA_exp: Uncharacterized protein A8136_3103 [Trichophyton benhamiae CBS 112371]|uniref:Transcription factor IIIC putative zinc-finger domain-containing protein n=1 Tax=Arthroderma benhamiae (strain ATCC MYA-4681 / CBS 112371) TaxID=663331 RepID=D4AZD0_ARTBC|nr:uncharacterized protein ARB_01550 [Trichophyton benhamiae CBS 112371]EFE31650.1 conserved hypothetical protein [Trichophyton benhamiae CBS 112371]DAA74787.1 TPA_exp: Uncharacterized protein A8136_3103 [Trichophyton benhamiae CBS 112371]